MLLLSYTYSLFVPPTLYAYLSNVKNVASLPKWLFYFFPTILWPEEKFSNPPFPYFYIFEVKRNMFKQNIYIGLILTLGIISPPLLILICLTSMTDYVTTRIAIMRYLKLSKDEESVRSIENSFEHVWRCPSNFMWYAVSFSCVFHVLFLLDMANDEAANFVDTIWIIILFTVVILFYRSIISSYKNFNFKSAIKETVYDNELKKSEIRLSIINVNTENKKTLYDNEFKKSEIRASKINLDETETFSPIPGQYLS